MTRAAVVVGLGVAVALAAVPVDAHAKCAMPRLEPQVLTHAADAIPPGGGVLVGWTTSRDWDKPRAEGDPAVNKTWRFTLRRRLIATTVKPLAPGLAVYAPRKRIGAKLTLASAGSFTFTKRKATFDAAAPVVKAVRTTIEDKGRWRSTSTVVELDAAPPSDAVGLIVYGAGQGPITWAVADASSTTITVFEDSGRCDVHPPAMRAPAVGEKVEAAWVDRFGRLTVRSSAVATE